ncbi:hypothetical protein MMC06_005387 [Schaereria dolodes]|nr:hypothetical protein [Schaereria dolodes]
MSGSSLSRKLAIAYELARRAAKVGTHKGPLRYTPTPRCRALRLRYYFLLHIAITFTSAGSEPSIDELIGKIHAVSNRSAAIKIQTDLHQIEAPKAIVKATLSAFSRDSSGFKTEGIDVLVNNAGVELVKNLVDITPDDLSHTFDLDVLGTMLMTQAVLPHLRKPGRIINISSVGARSGFSGLSAYCSSKAAMEVFTRCWVAELGPEGHTVNVVSPGPNETDTVQNIPRPIVDVQKSQIPMISFREC